jgi:t-SNARE complex subunit (syntaxin)
MCTPVTPAVPYLLLGLQDVQWAVGNSHGARKLARTPHVNKIIIIIIIIMLMITII